MAIEVAKVELKTVQDASGLEGLIAAGKFGADSSFFANHEAASCCDLVAEIALGDAGDAHRLGLARAG